MFSKLKQTQAGVWQADQLRRQGLSINDLYSKGYVKVKDDEDDTHRSVSIPNSASTKKSESGEKGTERKETIGALPVFEGGKWQQAP